MQCNPWFHLSGHFKSSKKADWGSTKEDKEDGDGEEDDVIDEKEEIRLRNKYAKGRGARSGH